MRLNSRFRWLLIGAFAAITALACRTSDVILAPAQPTTTRVAARATFTPAPTATPTPTVTPTRRPTLRPTARPPTAIPQPIAPPPPAATAPPYKYKAVNVSCVHSGQSFIQGTVYEGNSPVDGRMVIMSADLDGAVAERQESGTADPGKYSMIVSAFGGAPGQTRYIWISEGGRRVSDAGRISFNPIKNPDDPKACWRGIVDFQLWTLTR